MSYKRETTSFKTEDNSYPKTSEMKYKTETNAFVGEGFILMQRKIKRVLRKGWRITRERGGTRPSENGLVNRTLTGAVSI